MAELQAFDWQRHAAAENICLDALARFRSENAVLAAFERQVESLTSSRLLDWVDHLLLPYSLHLIEKLTEAGFLAEPFDGHEVYHHPGAALPRIVLTGDSCGPDPGVALRVESLADFLQANGYRADIEGDPFAPYRRALVAAHNGVAMLAVERRGSRTLDPSNLGATDLYDYVAAVERWRTRPRSGEDEGSLMETALRMAGETAARFGPDLAAHIVCLAERDYWLSRNFAGRTQKARQDVLGLGWGNLDHHTFRSSRRYFAPLVELFSKLGFHNRERFYAGEEAGWGAQVMENPVAGISLFLDVDLKPEEVETDFSREELPEREELGTVGLWCALHGDSILGAGMHHIAARFDFVKIQDDLARHGVTFMPPFSDFSYLKQAFSIAERRAVDAKRVERLLAARAISAEQAERFHGQGAIGSHLENIERREGYKGFNKKNVSLIIRETDPRKQT